MKTGTNKKSLSLILASLLCIALMVFAMGNLSVFGNTQAKADGNSTDSGTTDASTDSTSEESFFEDASGVWHITDGAGLAEFANSVTSANTFKDKTVKLDGNINMTGIAYASAGSNTLSSFCGTFDGCNYTISNLSITETGYYSGLFYILSGTVKDLTLTKANVKGVRAAVLAGASDSCTIENVTISDSVVTGEQKCAGLLGFQRDNATLKISGCNVRKVTVKAADTTYSDVQGASFGGLVGFIHRDVDAEITNNTVSDISFGGLLGEDFYAEHDTLYYQYLSHPFIGALMGITEKGTYESHTVTLSGNTVGASLVKLLSGPTTNKYLGFYYRSDFATKTLTKIVIDGKVLVNNAAAYIGDEYYPTLDAAVAAAISGDTIKLIADYTGSAAAGAGIVFDITGVTLDLNGFTFTSKNFAYVFEGTGGVIKNGTLVTDGSYALFVGDEGETTSFTVTDVELTGGINIYNATGVVLENLTVDGSYYYAVWLDEGTEATIKSGTYNAGDVASVGVDSVVTEDGEEYQSVLTIEGGTIYADNKPLMLAYGGKLIVKGGTFEDVGSILSTDKENSIEIAGGTFSIAIDEKYCAKGFVPTQKEDGSYGTLERQILGASVTLGEDISFNYYVRTKTDNTVVVAKYLKNGEMTEETLTEFVALSNSKYAGKYVFRGITPQMITRDITIVYTDGSVTDTIENYSVADYLAGVYKNENNSQDVRQLAADTMYYGLAAMKYCEASDEDVSALRTRIKELKMVQSNIVPADSSERSGESVVRASVRFDNANSLVFAVDNTTFEAHSDYKYYIGDTEITEWDTTLIDGYHVYVTDNLRAVEYIGKTFTVTVKSDDTVVQTLSTDAGSYCAGIYADETSADALKELAKATYIYGNSAKAYATENANG